MAVTQNLRAVVESLSELLEGHLRLFKVELSEDARVVGVEVGKIAALAPLLLVGYGFLCVALALVLGRVMAPDLAFLLVGALNLAIAGSGIYLAVVKLKARQWLPSTAKEVDASRATLAHSVKRELPDAG